MELPGEELERAIHQIENAIISAEPGLRETSFSIERRKRVRVGGVLHEIDIWVTIPASHQYHGIFIFECKDWSRPVSKNEVIVFAEKIRAVGAQRGFIVAREFSSYACAQAQQSRQIELITLADKPNWTGMDFRIHARSTVDCKFDFHRKLKIQRAKPFSETVSAILDGDPIDLGNYLDAWVEELVPKLDKEHEERLKASLGEWQQITASYERHFSSKQLFVDGNEIEAICVHMSFRARYVQPAIISSYEAVSRGRFWSFAPVEVSPGKFLKIEAVNTE